MSALIVIVDTLNDYCTKPTIVIFLKHKINNNFGFKSSECTIVPYQRIENDSWISHRTLDTTFPVVCIPAAVQKVHTEIADK